MGRRLPAGPKLQRDHVWAGRGFVSRKLPGQPQTRASVGTVRAGAKDGQVLGKKSGKQGTGEGRWEPGVRGREETRRGPVTARGQPWEWADGEAPFPWTRQLPGLGEPSRPSPMG